VIVIAKLEIAPVPGEAVDKVVALIAAVPAETADATPTR
jgi:hypothetical protein